MAATTSGKTRCIICQKDKATSKCSGCLEDFCLNHLVEHRQQLSKQLDELEHKRNIFRQTLSEQSTNPQKHSLIQQINQWEIDSIEKIKQTADETRQLLLKHTAKHRNEIEQKLIKLTEELKQTREEDDFTEIELKTLKQKLNQLEEILNKPSNILIRQEESSSFVNKIVVVIASASSTEQLSVPNININTKWIQNGITVAGGNGRGADIHQFSEPFGICVDDDGTIYVADKSNHRIVEWKKGATSGQAVAGGKGSGNQNDQLNGPWNLILDKKNDSLIICDSGNSRVMRWPRRNGTTAEIIISNIGCHDLSMDNDGYLYVCDYGKDEVRRWKVGETNGTLVAGGNGKGNRLNQLCDAFCIFVDQNQSVYVSEWGNHRVTKWEKGAKEGIVVAGGQGQGNGLKQLSTPRGIVVDHLGTVYVADFSNSRVVRWLKGATEGSVVVGGNQQGVQPNQLNSPIGLSFDRENNLYVLNYGNSRVQKFNIDSH